MRFLRGYFSETLPGPVRQLALLRCDSDMFISIYQTLDALYPKLAVGGFVVFDDWKIPQAKMAVEAYRHKHGITTPVLGTSGRRRQTQSFDTMDPMAFWRKPAEG